MFCPLLACLSSHFCGQSDFCASEEGRESLAPPPKVKFFFIAFLDDSEPMQKKSNCQAQGQGQG